MSNPTTFVPWQYPISRVIQSGDVVITEITVTYYRYGAKIHRPFAVVTKPTALYSKLYEAALDCFNVSGVLRQGSTTQDIIRAFI